MRDATPSVPATRPASSAIVGRGAKGQIEAFLDELGLQLSSLTGSANTVEQVLPALTLNGCFLMLVLATAAMQTFRDVTGNDAVMAHAQQVKNMLGQGAAATGTALATVILQWRSTVQYGVLNAKMTPSDPLFHHRMEQLGACFSRSTDAVQAAKIAMAQQAQEIAQHATLVAGIE